MIAVDLFAGIGGITLGMESVGIHTQVAIELDKRCVDFWKTNFPKSTFLNADIQNMSEEKILEHIPAGKEVDLVCGGPPCQGFSMIGLRNPSDPRSGLVFEYRRIVQELKPKYFVFENVPGILSMCKGRFFEELKSLFRQDGYRICEPVQVLNAAEYGVPQNRKRVFLLGTREDLAHDLTYPHPTHVLPTTQNLEQQLFTDHRHPTPTVWDAIHDLPKIDQYSHLIDEHEVAYSKHPKSEYAKMMRGFPVTNSMFGPPPNTWNSKICANCRRTVHSEALVKRFKKTKGGETAPISRLYKLSWEGVSNTLRAGTLREGGGFSAPRPIHPEQPRVVSVREGARLQGFPDWFMFHPTKWHGFRQVGNSVSPLVARAIGKKIVETAKANESAH